MATGLEKVSFHSNPKEGQCQWMLNLPHNCTHLTCWHGEGNGTPLQYSCLENPMDRGAGRLQSMGSRRVRHYWATSLSLFTFMMEKEMATHSSVLAWRIPGTAEPGGLQSMGSHRVGHDWSNLAAAAAHASKVMLKILQAGLQQYMNQEFPDVQAGFWKGRGIRDQIVNICWII